MEKLRGLIADRPVVIFSRNTCYICHTIKYLICGFGANPTVYELDEMQEGKEIERSLQEMGCDPSVPAVFIGQKLIGGSKEVISLQVKNKLGPLLREARAIWM